MSKILSLILPCLKDKRIAAHLKENLLFVFEKNVTILEYYLDDLGNDKKILGDVFLLPLERGIFDLVGLVEDLSNVIIITRVPSKQKLTPILQIPDQTDVLVVNDTDEATVQLTKSLYELGFAHINLVPYLRGQTSYEHVQKFNYAITPDEKELVPYHIQNVIDIGNRMIDTYTILRIINKLGVSDPLVKLNLVKYSEYLAEPTSSVKEHFNSSFIQTEMLKSYSDFAEEAISMCDISHRIIYANRSFSDIFSNYTPGSSLSDLIEHDFFMNFRDASSYVDIIKINGITYQFTKSPICMAQQQLGYTLLFRNESSIRDMEKNLKKSLQKNGLFAKHHFHDIVHNSPVMKECLSLAKKAAKSDYNILIQGESGTGKELLAQAIHNFSDRAESPFVAINCAAMTESLLESELFGYEAGAFTGAKKGGKIGLFEQADGGTLFLDEISETPLSFQRMLLRVLQEKQFMKVGGTTVKNTDVRMIAASNKNLQEECKKGTFRRDLYYRIGVLPITLPPLRERGDDILLLLKQFLPNRFVQITESQKRALLRHSWPGNVRELENCACYFKTIGEFPVLNSPDENRSKAPCDNRKTILSIIEKNTSVRHGIGRNSLKSELTADGCKITDTELSQILRQLESGGLIRIGKGRIGAMITKSGKDYLL